MKAYKIAILITLIIISQVYGHKITKRQLDNPKTKLNHSTNKTIPTIPTTTTKATKEVSSKKVEEPVIPTQINLNLSSSNQPEILAPPFDDATEGRNESIPKGQEPIGESEMVVVFPIDPTDEEIHAEKLHEIATTINNSSGVTPSQGILPLQSSAIKPVQIMKEDCTCFSIRRPKTKIETKKFENATTSVLSEIESEIGILFEIAAGALPKVNNHLENKASETLIKTAEVLPGNGSDVENNNNEAPFFEDFVPFFPLETFLGHGMPHETIIIQTDAENIEPSNLLAKHTQNGSNPIEKDDTVQPLESKSTTPQNDMADDKKPVSA